MPKPSQAAHSICSPWLLGISALILTGITTILGQQAVYVQAQEAGSPAPAESVQPESVQPESVQPGERPTLSVGSEGEAVTELQGILKLLGYYSGAVDGMYRASTAAAVSAFQQAIGLQADGVVGTETWNQLLPLSPALSPSVASEPPVSSPTATTTPSPSSSPSSSPSLSPSSVASPPATPTPSASPAPAPSPAASPSPSPSPAAPSPSPTSDNAPIELPILRLGMSGSAVARLQDRLKALGFFNGETDGIFGQETQTAVQAAQRNYNLEPDGIVGPATWTVLLQP